MRLNGKIILTGQGLHSGQECRLTIEPCDSEVVLMRAGENELSLREFELSGTNRGSDYIFPDGTRIRTCEHVLSALSGLGIWSEVRLIVEGGEMPALDGCSKTVCDEILQHLESETAKITPARTLRGEILRHSESEPAKITPARTLRGEILRHSESEPAKITPARTLRGEILRHSESETAKITPARTLRGEILRHSESETAKSEPVSVKSPVAVYAEDKTRFITALPYDGLRITYIVEYKYIGTQVMDYVSSPENYYENICSARTFAMKSDIDYLRSHGMALGGSLDNAIVIGETIQAKNGLHWPDEFVRHKILDLLGDLAAVGKPVNAHIIAVKAGHELHLKLAEKLRQI